MNENIIKLINDICWWIPFRSKRNLLRNQLISAIEDNMHVKNREIYKFIKKAIDLTTNCTDFETKKRIFKENVCLVEIGIFSYCNRKCWFCPNSVIDRHSNNVELREDIFLKILNELKDINYSNGIRLHRYNEPLYDIELLIKRIKQVKEYLPNSKIQINTNGDYMNYKYLIHLKDAGIDSMLISYYYNGSDKNIEFNLPQIKSNMNKLIQKLKLNYHIDNESNNSIIMKSKYYNIDITYSSINMNILGCDRVGVVDLKSKIRTAPCFHPNMQVSIDYDGIYTLCCNIRSDIKEHENYLIGNVENNNIFELFTNDKIIEFRKRLLRDNSKKFGACAYCSMGTDVVNNLWFDNRG